MADTTRTDAPAQVSARSPDAGSPQTISGELELLPSRVSNLEWALVVAWLFVPALQYFGAVQRTRLILEGGATLPALAEVDFTPLYVLLLAITMVLAIKRIHGQSSVAIKPGPVFAETDKPSQNVHAGERAE